MQKPVLQLIALLLAGCRDPSATPSIAPDPTKTGPVTNPTTPPAATPSPSPKLPTFPAIRLECKTDADCAGTFMGADCCDHCGSTVGNKTWIKEIDEYCQLPSSHPHTCPDIDCPYQPYDARCISGVCTKVPRK